MTPTLKQQLAVAETVLEEAQHLIYGERQGDYGPPTASFDSIARLWDAYLDTKISKHHRDAGCGGSHCGRYHADWHLIAVDVAHLMVLLKVSRNTTGGYKRDNAVDIAGYAGCIERIEENR